MKLSIYFVHVRVPQGGEYIPPDPVAGGDYYADKVYAYTVTAGSAALARSAVQGMHGAARTKLTVKKLGPAI